jgi:hypothetical protein
MPCELEGCAGRTLGKYLPALFRDVVRPRIPACILLWLLRYADAGVTARSPHTKSGSTQQLNTSPRHVAHVQDVFFLQTWEHTANSGDCPN